MDDYRITAGYDSIDLVNGGLHRAVDVGNFRQGYPVYTPGPCVVEGLKHFDGALGLRFYPPNGEVWELWHLDSTVIPAGQKMQVAGGVRVGSTGDTGLGTGAHTHIEREIGGVRVDPEAILLGQDYDWDGEEGMVICKPVREQWSIPAGTEFWIEGPGQGPSKSFTSVERRWSNGESTDGVWRRVEYDAEELWIRRADIVPVPNTRNPAKGYGSAAMGWSTAQVRAEKTKVADEVLEATKAAAGKYGAS